MSCVIFSTGFDHSRKKIYNLCRRSIFDKVVADAPPVHKLSMRVRKYVDTARSPHLNERIVAVALAQDDDVLDFPEHSYDDGKAQRARLLSRNE